MCVHVESLLVPILTQGVQILDTDNARARIFGTQSTF